MAEINVDAEALMGLFSKNPYSEISDTASNYSDEWLTVGAIQSGFSVINQIKQQFENLKSSANHYANEGIEIDDWRHAPELIAKANEAKNIQESIDRMNNVRENRLENAQPNGNEYKVFNEEAATELNRMAFQGDDEGARKYIEENFTGKSKEKAIEHYNSRFSDGNHIKIEKETSSGTSTEDIAVKQGLQERTSLEKNNTNLESTVVDDKLTLHFDDKVASQLDAFAVSGNDEEARNLINQLNGEDKETGVYYYNQQRGDGKNHIGEVPSSMDPQYSQSTAKQYEPKSVKTATVNTNSGDLNVRTKPNGQVITSIPKDSTVTVVKDDGSGWAEVKLEDGTTGVVSSKYLNINGNSNTVGDKILVNSNVKIENPYGEYKTDSYIKKDVFTSEDATKINDYISNNQGDVALKYVDEKFVGDAKDTANQYIHEKLGR